MDMDEIIKKFTHEGSTTKCYSCAIYQECYDAWHIEPSCGGYPPDWMCDENGNIPPDESPEIDIFEKVKHRGNCTRF